MNKRRRHSKIDELPPDLVEVINRKLAGTDTDGRKYTYREIADFLDGLGHAVSKSSVGRYGQNFLARLERLKIVKDQARAIVTDNADRPSTELAEAANQLAMNLIMETLMEVENLKGEKLTEILKALARLEASGVRREALKLKFSEGVEAAAGKIKEALRKELDTHPDILSRVSEIVEQAKAQVAS